MDIKLFYIGQDSPFRVSLSQWAQTNKIAFQAIQFDQTAAGGWFNNRNKFIGGIRKVVCIVQKCFLKIGYVIAPIKRLVTTM